MKMFNQWLQGRDCRDEVPVVRDEVPVVEAPLVPNPDHAWKQLAMVNEWIRHSDAKAGATLAAAGVLATITFDLAGRVAIRTCVTDVLIAATCFVLVLTGTAAAWTLTPRVRDRGADPAIPNRVFFGSVAKNFSRDEYRGALTALTSDPVSLVHDLADQIHVNAVIASSKAQYAKWAIRGALGAVALLAALAAVIDFVTP